MSRCLPRAVGLLPACQADTAHHFERSPPQTCGDHLPPIARIAGKPGHLPTKEVWGWFARNANRALARGPSKPSFSANGRGTTGHRTCRRTRPTPRRSRRQQSFHPRQPTRSFISVRRRAYASRNSPCGSRPPLRPAPTYPPWNGHKGDQRVPQPGRRPAAETSPVRCGTGGGVAAAAAGPGGPGGVSDREGGWGLVSLSCPYRLSRQPMPSSRH